MKSQTLKTIAIFFSLLTAATVQAGEWSGNVGGYLGKKTLDDKDWPQHDKHDSIGMVLDFKKKDWPVSVAVDWFGTGDENQSGSDKNNVYSAEAHIGVRKIFELPIPDCKLRPYVGGGLALVHAEQEIHANGVTSKSDDSDQGYWIGTGTYYRVSENLNLGLDVRYSEAQVRLGGDEREAGGVLAGLGVGYHW